MTDRVKAKDRKIGVLVMLDTAEIQFLDRKIIKKDEWRASRSALIRLLIRKSMLRPQLFDTDWVNDGE